MRRIRSVSIVGLMICAVIMMMALPGSAADGSEPGPMVVEEFVAPPAELQAGETFELEVVFGGPLAQTACVVFGTACFVELPIGDSGVMIGDVSLPVDLAPGLYLVSVESDNMQTTPLAESTVIAASNLAAQSSATEVIGGESIGSVLVYGVGLVAGILVLGWLIWRITRRFTSRGTRTAPSLIPSLESRPADVPSSLASDTAPSDSTLENEQTPEVVTPVATTSEDGLIVVKRSTETVKSSPEAAEVSETEATEADPAGKGHARQHDIEALIAETDDLADVAPILELPLDQEPGVAVSSEEISEESTVAETTVDDITLNENTNPTTDNDGLLVDEPVADGTSMASGNSDVEAAEPEEETVLTQSALYTIHAVRQDDDGRIEEVVGHADGLGEAMEAARQLHGEAGGDHTWWDVRIGGTDRSVWAVNKPVLDEVDA